MIFQPALNPGGRHAARTGFDNLVLLGTAKMVDIIAQTAQHTVGLGTAVYHPPEAITGRYSAAIDAFSLGMTVLDGSE